MEWTGHITIPIHPEHDLPIGSLVKVNHMIYLTTSKPKPEVFGDSTDTPSVQWRVGLKPMKLGAYQSFASLDFIQIIKRNNAVTDEDINEALNR